MFCFVIRAGCKTAGRLKEKITNRQAVDINYEFYYHELEESNWWFVARRDMILRMLADTRLDKSASILEIGCSGGALIKDLYTRGYSDIHGIDISEKAIQLSKKRGIRNTQVMDGVSPAFPDRSFDLIIASDVLEHLERDNVALANWYRLLKEGGRLIVFVPAFQSLWSDHDAINHHFRRYSRNGLKNKATATGFVVDKSSYWNTLLFFPVWILRKLLKFQNSEKGNLTNPNVIVNKLLIAYLKFENLLIHLSGSPIGVSCYLLARKPTSK